jgi:hypothetical protein
MSFINVDGYDGATLSSYTLNVLSVSVTPAPTPAVTSGPANPSAGCSSAPLLATPSRTIGVTTGATLYAAVECRSARATNSAGLWYKVMGTGQQLSASLCEQADYDTQLSVWTGPCSNLVCVGGNDDACGLKSRVSWLSTAGQTYYVFVCKWFAADRNQESNLHIAYLPRPFLFSLRL